MKKIKAVLLIILIILLTSCINANNPIGYGESGIFEEGGEVEEDGGGGTNPFEDKLFKKEGENKE